MNSLHYLLNPNDSYIGRSLYEQYNVILFMIEKYKPEWYFNVATDDLFEYHHILWKLPFYKKIFKVSTNKSIFSTTETYCQLIDSTNYSIELMKIKVWKLTKTYFKGSWVIKKEEISIRNDAFDEYFNIIINRKEILYDELPEGLKRNID